MSTLKLVPAKEEKKPPVLETTLSNGLRLKIHATGCLSLYPGRFPINFANREDWDMIVEVAPEVTAIVEEYKNYVMTREVRAKVYKAKAEAKEIEEAKQQQAMADIKTHANPDDLAAFAEFLKQRKAG